MNIFSQHIPSSQLADLAEGRLAPEEQSRVLAHTSNCNRCGSELAALQRLVELMRTDDSESAPDAVIARAVKLFRRRASPTPSGLRERILASLQFDSAQWRPAMALRSAEPTPRQLLFNAGDNSIDLRVTRAQKAWVISGQVLGPATIEAVGLRGPSAELQVEPNELNEFTLPPVTPGAYSLTLVTPQHEIEIPRLDLEG